MHKYSYLSVAGMLASVVARAEGPKPPSSLTNPVVIVMVVTMLMLLVVIKSLAGLLLSVARKSMALGQGAGAGGYAAGGALQANAVAASAGNGPGNGAGVVGAGVVGAGANGHGAGVEGNGGANVNAAGQGNNTGQVNDAGQVNGGGENVAGQGNGAGAGGRNISTVILAGLIFGMTLISSSGLRAEGGEGGATSGAVSGAGAADGKLLTAAAPMVNGMSNTTFYMMAAVLGVEILVVLYLVFNLNVLVRDQAAAGVGEAGEAAVKAARPAFSFSRWWSKINSFRPVEEEAAIDLGHNYDGIRELDNKLPPWWLYGFYCTILFACIYLWRYHVSQTAPLPAEEYKIAVKEAEARKEEYLKKAANSVDENSVKLLTAQPDLDAGKAIFESNCFACHGKLGEGGVGPNLTDDYWLHGGSINEVFKTVKYGWPEKGMKSWKDDLSPSQMAQVASFVKSLAHTNPPNGKAPQGVLVK